MALRLRVVCAFCSGFVVGLLTLTVLHVQRGPPPCTKARILLREPVLDVLTPAPAPTAITRKLNTTALSLVPCPAQFGWGNTTDGFFPSVQEALDLGAGDVPGLKLNKRAPNHVPRMKRVVVVGKGGSSIPVQKTHDNIIVTVNHALAWINYSDIHFQLDWYFHHVRVDFFCRARALVIPTYFHVKGVHFIHASVFLSRLTFTGPVFLVQLPDGPRDSNIEVWTGKQDMVHSSGDLAFAWMLRHGYRDFESYGIGGSGYADYFVSSRYSTPKRFVQSAAAHHAQIARRFRKYNATWIQH